MTYRYERLPVQAAEDKTFGLKNKNKSAKVQQCAPTPHMPCGAGCIVPKFLRDHANCLGLHACRYVNTVKKNVDDAVSKQKTAANAHKVCPDSGMCNARSAHATFLTAVTRVCTG